MLNMHLPTILLLAAPLLSLAAPAPFAPGATDIDLTVYASPECKGPSHERKAIKYDDRFEDSPATRSYRLSKELGDYDYLWFGSERPYAPKNTGRKAGCHNLQQGAFFFTFTKETVKVKTMVGGF
ncbi:MAG: hypothetical protein Q9218_004021 [Villophora microphyllina]